MLAEPDSWHVIGAQKWTDPSYENDTIGETMMNRKDCWFKENVSFSVARMVE